MTKDANETVLSSKIISDDEDPYVYLPVKAVSEALGCTVSWNDAEKMIVITKPPELL